jgi:cell division septation protein DedD
MRKKNTGSGWFASILTGYLFGVCGILLGIFFIAYGEESLQRYVPVDSVTATLSAAAEVIAPQESPVVEPPRKGLYTVQLGAFRSKERAEKLQSTLRRQGYTPEITLPDQRSGYYRLQVGDFHEKAEANRFRNQLAGSGYDGFVRERF